MTITIDSHQHFWSLARGDYAWLTPDLEVLYRDFQPDQLAPLLSTARVSHTVLVQAAATTAETLYMLELADQTDFIAGVVGWVDFDAGADALITLTELARHERFVGVRPMIHDIDDPAWMLRTTHRPLFEKLIELDLCFDALVRTAHLPYLQDLLASYPSLRMVVDHGAKPEISKRAWRPWAAEIKAIAQHRNAWCKLSGLITEAAVNDSYEALTPYMDYLLECFGTERLMWGSDWPVIRLNGDYAAWHAAVTQWMQRLNSEQQAAILGGNANRFYRLGIPFD